MRKAEQGIRFNSRATSAESKNGCTSTCAFQSTKKQTNKPRTPGY